MTKVEIGYLFKEIRLERGLTITDVAGNMSASTVSKFENGHSEISAEKLILLLNRLGMDATEFFKILSIKQNGLESLNNFSQRSFDKYLMQLALEQDIEGLIHFRKQFTDQYQKTHAKLYKLREIIVSAIIIDTQNTHAVLSKTDSTFINDYLMARDVWYELEYSLYGDCVSFLQSPDFDRLYAKFLTIHFIFLSDNAEITLTSSFNRSTTRPLRCITGKNMLKLYKHWTIFKTNSYLILFSSFVYSSAFLGHSASTNSQRVLKRLKN